MVLSPVKSNQRRTFYLFK